MMGDIAYIILDYCDPKTIVKLSKVSTLFNFVSTKDKYVKTINMFTYLLKSNKKYREKVRYELENLFSNLDFHENLQNPNLLTVINYIPNEKVNNTKIDEKYLSKAISACEFSIKKFILPHFITSKPLINKNQLIKYNLDKLYEKYKDQNLVQEIVYLYIFINFVDNAKV